MPDVAEQIHITVPARAAAYAWLNAFLASSTDEKRPLLCRTLSLEWFTNGIQLIGCDGTVLFRTWVPDEGDQWPGIDEAPIRSVVVMDPEGFGIGFMRTLLRVTSDEEHQHETLTIDSLPHDEGATLELGAEFMRERIALRACGQRIDLLLFEQAYPNWRGLEFGIDDFERVGGMTLATRIFGLVGKLKAVSAADLKFAGREKRIEFTASGGESEVRGLLMPMRKPVAKDDDTPENCRWASRFEQAQNRCDTKLLTHDGITQSIAAWAASVGMSPATLHARLEAGEGLESAMRRPANQLYNPNRRQIETLGWADRETRRSR